MSFSVSLDCARHQGATSDQAAESEGHMQAACAQLCVGACVRANVRACVKLQSLYTHMQTLIYHCDKEGDGVVCVKGTAPSQLQS